MTQADRAAFSVMAATRQGDIVDAESVLNQANLVVFNKQINNAQQGQLAQIEGAVSRPALPGHRRRELTLQQWQGLAGKLLKQYFAGGVNVARPSWRTTARSAGRRGRRSRSPAASAWSACSLPLR